VKLWRVTFKHEHTLHSTVFQEETRESAVKAYHDWINGMGLPFEFVACVEIL
jgi:hypothetical protein